MVQDGTEFISTWALDDHVGNEFTLIVKDHSPPSESECACLIGIKYARLVMVAFGVRWKIDELLIETFLVPISAARLREGSALRV